MVGFARRRPDLEVYAFDLNPRSRELVTELARRNGVDSRVHSTLARLEGGGRSLLICDI